MKKRLFALAGALLLTSGNISAEEPITYGNVAIPEIHKKRKKKN